MTDEQSRKAQQAMHRIRTALSEGTLSQIETTAEIDGWLHMVKPEIERRRMQLAGKRGRR